MTSKERADWRLILFSYGAWVNSEVESATVQPQIELYNVSRIVAVSMSVVAPWLGDTNLTWDRVGLSTLWKPHSQMENSKTHRWVQEFSWRSRMLAVVKTFTPLPSLFHLAPFSPLPYSPTLLYLIVLWRAGIYYLMGFGFRFHRYIKSSVTPCPYPMTTCMQDSL